MYISPKLTKDKLISVAKRLCDLLQRENIQNPATVWQWREHAENNPEKILKDDNKEKFFTPIKKNTKNREN